MRNVVLLWLCFGGALALGCSSANGSSGNGGYGKQDGGFTPAGRGGSSGSGGGGGPSADAGGLAGDAARQGDASAEAAKPNLTTDGPSFNWDTLTCSGCLGDGGASAGGASAGGSSGAAGSYSGSGGRGAGGAMSSGGMPSGSDASTADGAVAPGGGGKAGTGGSSGGGGSTSSAGDAGIVSNGGNGGAGLPDASSDARGPEGGSGGGGTSGADASPGGPDAQITCAAQIVPVIPALPRIDRLVAGSNTKVVLRVAGGTPGATWSWQATWEGSPLSVIMAGSTDTAAAMFSIANPGTYTFRATSGGCAATVSGYAVAANACTSCDRSVILRAAPPVSSGVPMQSGALTLLGSSPFDQNNVILARGVAVSVAPSLGSSFISSYVRINDSTGSLVVDGLADSHLGGFSAQLLALDSRRSALQYDVLVVPLDGSDTGTIAATAPQLYQNRDPGSIKGSFPLAGGVTVTGTVLSSSGQPVVDARVMLTNQDPAAAQQRRDLIFSSVGRSDAQGKYTLHVQKGTYWVSFSPPPGSGLSEALSAASVNIGSDSTLAFAWAPSAAAALSLQVLDSTGAAAREVSVRVTSSQSKGVGTVTLTPSGGSASSQQANGNVHVEAATDASGSVVFANLPAGLDYDILSAPASPGPFAATTTLGPVNLAAGGTSKTITLLAQSGIKGQLVARTSSSLPIDFATVTIIGYDRSVDAPEAPRSLMANGDGSFSFGATPGRPYVLMAVPDINSGYARSFVGPGPLQTSEFLVTQNLLTSMDWKAAVMDESQHGIAETALQAFCDATWPNCVDPAVPLAETTSDVGGAFQLELADPASR